MGTESTQSHTPTVVQGWGDGWTPPRSFHMLQCLETILHLVESLWPSLQDGVYFIGGGVSGGLWRHQQWSPFLPPSGILPRIRNQGKTAINYNFFVRYIKNNIKKALCMNLAKRFTFIVEKSWKKMYTYDVISRNHSSWPSLNLSQNVPEGWTNSCWKFQVLTFYPLRKISEKPYEWGRGGGGGYVRGLKPAWEVCLSLELAQVLGKVRLILQILFTFHE